MSTTPFFSTVVFLTGICAAIAQPAPFQTPTNTSLAFPVSALTANGLPGLTNPPAQLTVSFVAANSAHGGHVSLVNTQAWVQRYNAGPGSFFNQAAQVAADQSGNVFVTGNSYNALTGAYGYATVKYAGNGTALWTNRYDGGAGDAGGSFPHHLALDAAGNVVVAGESHNLSTGADVVTIRYSADGVAMLTNRYGTANDDQSPGMVLDAASNACLIVQSYPPDSSQWDYVTLEYNAAGNAVWTNFYKGSTNGFDVAEGIAADAAGNVFITGGSVGTNGQAMATLKYSAGGAALWTNIYQSAVVDQGRTLFVDPAGNVLVAGESISISASYPVIKYTNNGTPLWTNILAGPNYSGGLVPQITMDVAGNIFVIGGAPGTDGPGIYTVLKLNSNGVPLWTNLNVNFNGTNASIAASAVDNAGNLYAAGFSKGPGGTGSDYVILKFSRDGTALWTSRYDGPVRGDDLAIAMTVDGAGNVYVTGQSASLDGTVDFATVKYADEAVYTPPTSFIGTDTFTFVGTDNAGNTATGLVQIVVGPQPLRFNPGALELDSLGLHLQVNGAAGTNAVVIYASSDLLNWIPLATNPPVAGSVQFLDTTATNAPRRFYRASQP